MGNCYFKKCSIILNRSEIEVFEKIKKKEEDFKKEVIIKTDFENLNNNNLNILQNNNINGNNTEDKKEEEKEKYKETKEKEEEKENENKKEEEGMKRRLAKQKIMKTIKTTKPIIQLKK